MVHEEFIEMVVREVTAHALKATASFQKRLGMLDLLTSFEQVMKCKW